MIQPITIHDLCQNLFDFYPNVLLLLCYIIPVKISSINYIKNNIRIDGTTYYYIDWMMQSNIVATWSTTNFTHSASFKLPYNSDTGSSLLKNMDVELNLVTKLIQLV